MPRKKPGPYQTPEILALRREWYGKLADEGFEDIEIIDWSTGESGNLLHGFTRMDAVRRGSIAVEAIQEHFYQCTQWESTVEGYNNPFLLDVWRRYIHGESIVDISRHYGIGRKRIEKLVHDEIRTMRKALQARASDPDLGD